MMHLNLHKFLPHIINSILISRCNSCCYSVAKENCDYKSGTSLTPISSRKKSLVNSSQQFSPENPKCPVSSSGKTSRLFTKGDNWVWTWKWIKCKFTFQFCSIIFLRYASLYFCCAIEQNDNELLTLEIIHRYVELLDKYFGSVRIPTISPKSTNWNTNANN